MSDPNNLWNPEDGPAPTADELAEARVVGERVAGAPDPRRVDRDPDHDALVAVALRVRATAHPDRQRGGAVVSSAVEHAVASAGPRWFRSRWRWVAAAAAVALGVGGTQWALVAQGGDDGVPSITRPATDIFRAPLGRDPGSEPIGRIVDARMGAYRDVLLHHRAPAGRRSR